MLLLKIEPSEISSFFYNIFSHFWGGERSLCSPLAAPISFDNYEKTFGFKYENPNGKLISCDVKRLIRYYTEAENKTILPQLFLFQSLFLPYPLPRGRNYLCLTNEEKETYLF